MLRIFVTKNFERAFRKLPKSIQIKAEEKIQIFKRNIKHPSLNLEKLQPTRKNFWSFRIDKNYRVIFIFLEDKAVELRDARHHKDIYRKL